MLCSSHSVGYPRHWEGGIEDIVVRIYTPLVRSLKVFNSQTVNNSVNALIFYKFNFFLRFYPGSKAGMESVEELLQKLNIKVPWKIMICSCMYYCYLFIKSKIRTKELWFSVTASITLM